MVKIKDKSKKKKIPKPEYKNLEIAKLKLELKKLKQENESLKKKLEKLENKKDQAVPFIEKKNTSNFDKERCPSCSSFDLIIIPRHDSKKVIVCKSCEYRCVK